VVDFRTEVLPTFKQSQGETLINQREEYLSFILERLRTLRLKLSTVYISAKQQVSAGASQPSSDVIALQGLALSCIEDSGKLLDDFVKIQRDFPRSGDSQLSVDAKSWFARCLEAQSTRRNESSFPELWLCIFAASLGVQRYSLKSLLFSSFGRH
jgi:hypothetical protein